MTPKEAIVEAVNRGYKITTCGNLIGMTGILKASTKKGYLAFGLKHRNSRKQSRVMVHRLQAYQLYGDAIFEPGIQVRHLNGNPSDNSSANIAIGTASDNMMDIPKEKRISKASKANKKYSPEIIRNWYESNGRSYAKTMANFGISSKGTLNFILKHAMP